MWISLIQISGKLSILLNTWSSHAFLCAMLKLSLTFILKYTVNIPSKTSHRAYTVGNWEHFPQSDINMRPIFDCNRATGVGHRWDFCSTSWILFIYKRDDTSVSFSILWYIDGDDWNTDSFQLGKTFATDGDCSYPPCWQLHLLKINKVCSRWQ